MVSYLSPDASQIPTPPVSKLFLSYRRDDGAHAAVQRTVQLWQRTRWAVGALVPAALILVIPAFLPSPIPDIAFVEIPAGTFEMGSEYGDSDEIPVHTVTISKPFSMSKYEITQGQWKEVMGTEPWRGEQFVQEGEDYPATDVSWYDADAFARRLDSLSGTHHYRLPTEAEWEYAARAGSSTEYSFGDEADSLGAYAWYEANASAVGEEYAHRVGQKRPNAWGLYDVHGNVWEWVSDWYASYESSPRTDPEGPATGSFRVFRGGNFFLAARNARSAYRLRDAPDYHDFILGFRLVRTDV